MQAYCPGYALQAQFYAQFRLINFSVLSEMCMLNEQSVNF